MKIDTFSESRVAGLFNGNFLGYAGRREKMSARVIARMTVNINNDGFFLGEILSQARINNADNIGDGGPLIFRRNANGDIEMVFEDGHMR